MYVTSHKRPFVPSVGGTEPSQFCETLAKITDWVTDPLRLFCSIFDKFVVRGSEFWRLPLAGGS